MTRHSENTSPLLAADFRLDERLRLAATVWNGNVVPVSAGRAVLLVLS